MDKKVEELVEWVARQLYDCKDKELRREDWDSMAPVIRAFYIGQYHWLIEQILSHPDLALIDRERMVISTVAKPKVIPLAEALKEE